MIGLLLAAAFAVPTGPVLVHYADPRCPPAVATVTLPDRADAACLMTEARLAAVRLVRAKGQAPGKKSPCWSYRDPNVYMACLDVAARKAPAISYGLSARWITGLNAGVPLTACMAGISGDPIFVSLAKPERVRKDTAWEAANSFLWLTYDRKDLTDGPLVGEATTAALAACGSKR